MPRIREFDHQRDKLIIDEPHHRIRRTYESAQPVGKCLQELIANNAHASYLWPSNGPNPETASRTALSNAGLAPRLVANGRTRVP